ncbi:cell division protein FtsZ [Bacillus sp. Bva_UNVM-123]|uniref:cell division protein FtsZ n=1 Tax=Bacillus sp. Bva_UNVM-123 TaxID=2829798 RepID=UPI00391F933C
MFGVVGIGQAGGNIAEEFAKLNYPTIAINFSKSDLDSLTHVKNKFQLLGSEGVGKQRNLAMSQMQTNWEASIEHIVQNFSQPSIEIILIVFSTAGGTGSGIAPFITEVLKGRMENKVFVACPILPDYNEVIGSQLNNQEATEELSEIDICVIPLDNQSQVKQFNKIPKNKQYEKINITFTSLIDLINSYTEKSSKNGVIDKRDVLQLFKTSGVMHISEANITGISNFKLQREQFKNIIHTSWDNSIFAPIQYEKIIRAGIIFDGDEKLMEYLQYDLLFEKFAHPPLELFEGYYHEGKGSVIIILSGLDWMYDRVKEVDNIIEKHKELLNSTESRVYKSKNTSKTALLDSVTKKPETRNRSVSEIFDKYAR